MLPTAPSVSQEHDRLVRDDNQNTSEDSDYNYSVHHHAARIRAHRGPSSSSWFLSLLFGFFGLWRQHHSVDDDDSNNLDLNHDNLDNRSSHRSNAHQYDGERRGHCMLSNGSISATDSVRKRLSVSSPLSLSHRSATNSINKMNNQMKADALVGSGGDKQQDIQHVCSGGGDEISCESTNRDNKRRLSRQEDVRSMQRDYKLPKIESMTIDQQFKNVYEGASLIGDKKGWRCSRLLWAVSVVISLLLLGLFVWYKWDGIIDRQTNYLGVASSPSRLGKFKSYAISTDAAYCAPMGSDILARGGSAVDAAITTLLCMGIVLPNSLGLGGGCLMTIYHRQNGTATAIDGREEAPDYATEDMYGNNSLAASRGTLSIGIPGEVAAYGEAHRRFGKLPWSDLFEAPIRLAEEGVPVVEHMENALYQGSHSNNLKPELRKLMTSAKTGKLLTAGEILKRPDLAKTLRRLRDHGPDDFYTGETARLLIDDLHQLGGKITAENLARYKAHVGPALRSPISHNLTLFTQPLPGSGLLLSMIMRIMDKLGYNGRWDVIKDLEESREYYHHLIETFKFAYAQRGGLDGDVDDERQRNLIERLMSDEFISQTARKINSVAHDNIDYYGVNEYFSFDQGTAHTSVVDSDGNAVAITSSVNLYFGSGVLSPSTGVIYNDIMDDFVSPGFRNTFGLAPSKYNRIAPGKRPLSSMVPSVFTDVNGHPRLVIGASGGSKITSAVALVSLRHLFLGDDIKTAIDGPRLHHQMLPNVVTYEPAFPRNILATLEYIGHKITPVVGRTSIVMAISIAPPSNNTHSGTGYNIGANSDHRKGGSVDGF